MYKRTSFENEQASKFLKNSPSQGKLKQFSVMIKVDDYSNFRKLEMATLELTENVTTGFVYNRTLTQHSVSVTLSYKVGGKWNFEL